MNIPESGYMLIWWLVFYLLAGLFIYWIVFALALITGKKVSNLDLSGNSPNKEALLIMLFWPVLVISTIIQRLLK